MKNPYKQEDTAFPAAHPLFAYEIRTDSRPGFLSAPERFANKIGGLRTAIILSLRSCGTHVAGNSPEPHRQHGLPRASPLAAEYRVCIPSLQAFISSLQAQWSDPESIAGSDTAGGKAMWVAARF
jgi:hypothetical protein